MTVKYRLETTTTMASKIYPREGDFPIFLCDTCSDKLYSAKTTQQQ